MKIYIDQSNKIEQTKKHTVVAFANSKQKAILIEAKEKRKLENIFRQGVKPYIFRYKTLAILIYLLIKDDLSKIDCIIIDTEYTGKEPLIKDFLIQIIRKKTNAKITKDDIYFSLIGKKNKAHEKAINVFRKKEGAEKTATCKDIAPYIL